MTSFLARFFIKDNENTNSTIVRNKYGILFGIVGIVLNIILFVFKLIAGLISGSIAIVADAINNISDSGSSIITLLGFKLANKKPDTTHPFGHGRFEYISGLIVSLAIILMGFELGISSIEKIIEPIKINFSIIIIVILGVSILVKLIMFIDGYTLSKKINSPSIKATAKDSISDTISTTVVLISTIISQYTNFNSDAWGGCLVALFILYSGLSAAKDTISPLLGQPPTQEFVNNIENIVMNNDEILGIHDLIVHDYGPGRVLISLHAEVSASSDIMETHDIIDNIESELSEKLGCLAVIHMDPICDDDEITKNLKQQVSDDIKSKIDDRISIHDFRMVVGPTHTNLIFDVAVPLEITTKDEVLTKKINDIIKNINNNYFAVIKYDRVYVINN